MSGFPYTLEEAAELANITNNTLLTWIQIKYCPENAVVILDGDFYFKRLEYNEWIKSLFCGHEEVKKEKEVLIESNDKVFVLHGKKEEIEKYNAYFVKNNLIKSFFN